MRYLRVSGLMWLGVGILLGGTTRLAFSVDKPPPTTASNPNVVLLRGEKMVSLEKPNVLLRDMVEIFSKQTGYKLTLDKQYQEDEAPYQFLLSAAPVTRALSAVGYLAHGKWERTKEGYHLRPLLPSEGASDITQYEMAVQKAQDYLSKIDPNDPTLSDRQQMNLRDWLDIANRRNSNLPSFPVDSMADWRLNVKSNGFGLSYSERTDDGNSGSWKSGGYSWSWP